MGKSIVRWPYNFQAFSSILSSARSIIPRHSVSFRHGYGSGFRSSYLTVAPTARPPDTGMPDGLSSKPASAPNAWSTPGPAAYDFRSDTSTTPTLSMLQAIRDTTLLDDVSHADPATNALEDFLCDLTSHPAALLVLSGTMGNQLAVRSHLGTPPHSVLCDHRAHLSEWEAGGAATLSGAVLRCIVPGNGEWLTLADVRRHVQLDDVEFHVAPTRLIALENTLGGEILPLEEARAITVFAREHDIRTHLDGARLWDAVAAQVAEGEHGGDLAKGLRAYCELFDSVSMCFSKGLGAPIGSILVGGEAFIRRARHMRKSVGGGMRMTGIIAAPARVSVEETFLGGKLDRAHDMARRVGGMWEERGGKLCRPVRTNMVWLDLEASGIGEERFVGIAEKHGVQSYGGRIVTHYQICEDAVQRLGEAMDEALHDASPQTASME
jgi:threonine aldolase